VSCHNWDRNYSEALLERFSSRIAYICFADGSPQRFLEYVLLEILEVIAERPERIVKRLLKRPFEVHERSEWRNNAHQVLAYYPLLDTAEDIEDLMGGIIRNAANISESASGRLGVPIRLSQRRANLLKSAKRLIDREQRKFELYRNTLNIEESQSIMRLTALATVFLPFSLAASMLSMQTRIASLQWLFYDFFGLFIILGTVAAVASPFLPKIITTMIYTKSYPWNMFLKGHRPPDVDKEHPLGLFWKKWLFVSISLSWSLIFSSFLIGLTKNPKFGLRVLGFGAASICILFGMPYLLSKYLVVQVIKDFKGWEKWKHRKNEIRKQYWLKSKSLKTVEDRFGPFKLCYPSFDLAKRRLVLWVGWSPPEEGSIE